jgi:hypothetical protein
MEGEKNDGLHFITLIESDKHWIQFVANGLFRLK